MKQFSELKDKKYASDFLATHLVDGSLVLFLGAGTSKGFGLPNWEELVNKLRIKVGLLTLVDVVSAEDLQRGADEVSDLLDEKAQLISYIKEILYPNQSYIDVKQVYSNPLLTSISSLLMGSKRGHVKIVVTFNYDSMLEWYLSLFGFMVKSISSLPTLEGSEDVRIYHPHGFVPHLSLGLEDSSFVIIGLNDANKRLGNSGDPWFEKLRSIFESSLCLFIGLSDLTLSDRAIAPLLSTCGEKVKNIRPLGIWISKDIVTERKESEFFRNNIVPLHIPDPIDISDFLLSISQSAMKKVNFL